MQSVIIGRENCSIFQGFCQDIQISGRQCFEVAGLRRGILSCLSRLGGGAFHPCLEDVKQGLCPYIFELRFNCRDGDQLSRWPFAPYEYRGVRYDIHMQRLLKVIVLGLFPDQNAIII